MERVTDLANQEGISRQTVYNRIRAIEEIIGKEVPRVSDREGFRVIDEDIARMVKNWKGRKPGRKKKNVR